MCDDLNICAQRRGLLSSALAVLLSTIACGSADPPYAAADRAFQQRDSSGIVIAETAGAVARAANAWAIDPQPQLQIGLMDGPEEYQLFRISGVAQLSGGHIVVVNGGSQDIRFYDGDGNFVHKVGGRGRGPGEFQQPRLVPSLSYDSLMIFDRPLRRLTILDPSGEFRGSHALGSVLDNSFSHFLGGIRDRLLAFHTTLYLAARKGPYPEPQPAEFRLMHAGDWTVDTIGVFPGQHWYTDVSNDQSASFTLPFDVMPSATVSRDAFFLTLGDGPEILEYGAAGRVRRVFRLLEPPRLVTDEALDAYIEVQLVPVTTRQAREYQRQIYRRMPRPEYLPSFDSLLVDDLGWLWARTYGFDPEAPRVWLVFDPDGRAHGSVEMPPGLDVRQIGGDFVLGTWRDEIGIEYVRRHELVRIP